MTLSRRLTRAGLAFVLFGTAAALLPSQDTSAFADTTCSTNPQYVLRLTTGFNTPPTVVGSNPVPVPHTVSGSPGGATLGAQASSDGAATFKNATSTNFSGRVLTFSITNTSPPGSGNLGIGATGSTTAVAPQTTVTYTPGGGAYTTGVFADRAGLTGTVTVTFQVGQISLMQTANLSST